jgi:hypothetical protein
MASSSPNSSGLSISHEQFSQRLKQIKNNLRTIGNNIKVRSTTHKNDTTEQTRLVQLQQEIAALVVLLPRIEKLLLKLNTNSWQRFLRFLKMSSRQQELNILFDYIEMAIEVLSYEQPSLLVAQKIRIDIERTVNRYQHPLLGMVINRFMDVYRSDSDPLKVVCGLALTSSVSAILFFGGLVGLSHQRENMANAEINEVQKRLTEIRETLAKDNIVITESGDIINGNTSMNNTNPLGNAIGGAIADENQQDLIREFREKTVRLDNLEDRQAQEQQDASILFLIVLVVSSGTLGSAISILIRINDFEKQDATDPIIPIFTGAFKPIIGSSFGLLIYAMFSSGIISVQIVPTDTVRGHEFFFCSLAFVIGFSERLAKDVIKRTEETLLGEAEPYTPPPQALPTLPNTEPHPPDSPQE